MIDWHAFDWPTFASLMQALSGLFVGVAAVVGAVTIGQRQAGISERQADIADRQTQILAKQVELEQRKLASDLYDRRYASYDAAAAFLVEAATRNSPRPTSELDQRFLIAFQESRFLFRPEVHAALEEINNRVQAEYALRRKMTADQERTGRYADGDPERELRSSEWLRNRINNLHELFPELNIF